MTEENDSPPPMPRPSPPPPSLAPPPPPPPVDESLFHPKTESGNPASANLNVKTLPDAPEDEGSKAGTVAEINPRLLAGVIDILVMVGIQWALIFILPGFAEKLGWVAGIAYLLGRDSFPFLKSGSIGKMAMRLQVVKLDGTPMAGDWTTGAVRNAALLIPFFGIVEAILLMNRESTSLKGRRLGDEWAKTKVVYAADPEENPG
ncbi:MAG: RDD family protein [Akkermansiaceae bacterium]|jgi:uncharacterized RDD family membrane protein YckC|nr:RDD family protein [Akkermansiaceae bacterium]